MTANAMALGPSTSKLALQPAAGQTVQVRIRAEYFEGQIDTKQLRKLYKRYQPISLNPLVLKPEQSRYVFISKFGAVIFWNGTPEIMREMLETITALPGAAERVESVADEMTINVGSERDAVTFNEVDVSELTLESLKIISLAFGQSVALDR